MTFEEVFSIEHLLVCARECLCNVRWKQSTQMFEINLLRWVTKLHEELLHGTYRSKGFTRFSIFERGKHREISSVHISERCVQKCLCKYALKPLIVPKLIYDNAATVEGRGTDFALNRLVQHLRYHTLKYNRKGGILTIDYHNYFGTIDHKILLEKLKNLIEDNRVYSLTAYFINCFPGNVGLGLGSEVSQICAVFYPNAIDHYFKDYLKIRGYARYMDDSYIISDDLIKLKEYKKIFIEKSKELGLEINEKMTQITPFDRGHFIYLKKRIFISETNKIIIRLLPKNITQRRRKIKKQLKMVEEKRMEKESFIQSFNSWEGYAKKYNSFKTVKNMKNFLKNI